MSKEYIYIPFNKTNKNYLEEIQRISAEKFGVQVVEDKNQHSLLLTAEAHELVSISTNPVYAVVTKLEETELANSVYELVTLQSKKICN
ncbi:MAG: hypothetical protein EOO42_03380 [Flavobacteriales bacterium]|nr:MAG: hypothetical protein EOO42_03380 [Flavobacteriales bacterium]